MRCPKLNAPLFASLALCLMFLLPLPHARAQKRQAAAATPSEAELTRVAYQSQATGQQREYFVYLPKGYKTEKGKKWPVLLFLHGNGERGNAKEELDYVLHHGPLYEAWVQKRDLPFIIVSPQLPMYGMDSLADYIRNRKAADIPRRQTQGVPPRPAKFPTPTPMTGAVQNPALPVPPEGPPVGWFMLEQDLLGIIESTLSTYAADRDRLYLSGISYGGFGAWYMAGKHPQLFAALVPVVGYGHPDLMKPIAERQLPLWVFAGGRDGVVQPQFFYPALNALESHGHQQVQFTIHADMNHDAWVRVYAGQDIYDWMLQQKRSKP
ncbi:carboxylesterase family protein [Cesiribacter andamanensis]|uniref:Poly(3-hydroxybutyrate) depolymerase n=1 Tax=Cesiribacter andamanensis AMV16 TaxID=1279009 RepID=M7P150_9BACT|nr:alpha/beta fold hydrolase [Cesiribacter andamanensis]EMR04309.1 Poly(3-hydroxybutyrate) depolymerase [Cesiribacter andamanensis AMV16]